MRDNRPGSLFPSRNPNEVWVEGRYIFCFYLLFPLSFPRLERQESCQDFAMASGRNASADFFEPKTSSSEQ